jgi:branched-chain amino acid aminotransferase
MIKADWVWRDGTMVPFKDANVHVLTHSLHYGLAAFEGIRCYEQDAGGAAIFRLDEHLVRLFNSAHICLMKVPFTREQISRACVDLVKKNGFMDGCYLRPLVYMGEGEMGIAANNPVHVQIIAWRWGAYLGEEGLKNGIRCMVSSFRRPSVGAMLSKGKITGHYVNSILARREANGAGFNEAILLDDQGYVCEGSGENLFMVSGGKVRTPPLGTSILQGITRETVIKLLEDQGVHVEPEFISRDELYCADEVFLTGTAAEITPVREIDNRQIGEGKPGPITRKLQETFRKVVRGTGKQYSAWLTPVE